MNGGWTQGRREKCHVAVLSDEWQDGRRPGNKTAIRNRSSCVSFGGCMWHWWDQGHRVTLPKAPLHTIQRPWPVAPNPTQLALECGWGADLLGNPEPHHRQSVPPARLARSGSRSAKPHGASLPSAMEEAVITHSGKLCKDTAEMRCSLRTSVYLYFFFFFF